MNHVRTPREKLLGRKIRFCSKPPLRGFDCDPVFWRFDPTTLFLARPFSAITCDSFSLFLSYTFSSHASVTKLPIKSISQPSWTFAQILLLKGGYVAEGSCCKLRSCFLRSSSVHAMSNKVPVWAVACVHSPSDMICFFQLAILMAKALSYANVIEERNTVKETCGNDWKEMPWASNTKKKKRNFRFFVDLSYFPLTPETVEELSRSFMMVPLMVNLLV